MVRLSDRETGSGELEREGDGEEFDRTSGFEWMSYVLKLSFWLISGSGVVVWFWRRGGCELEVRLAGS